MDCNMLGLPVRHQLPELTQTHVHRISDGIQPSHLLSSPSPPAFNLSQHQGSSHQVAKILEAQLQHQSFQWIVRTDFLLDGLVGSPCSPGDSQESSPTSQFKSINSLVLSFLYSPTLTSIHDHWKNHSLTRQTFVDKVMSLLINMLSSLKRLRCWERLMAGGEGDNRGRDGWMASLTQCTWVSAGSGNWWWTGKPGML